MSHDYQPFDALDRWLAVAIDDRRWQDVADHVAELRGDPTDLRWLEGPLRAAAYQSGAMEGLHPGDRGLTIALIDSTTMWQSAVDASVDGGGPHVVDFIEAGVEALHMALDVATEARSVSESWIGQVHEVACRPQVTYRVQTAAGPQDHPLPKGAYKIHDNHVRLADDSMLWFAPASEVPHEMRRFATELTSPKFEAAHPVVQAAFAHHALTHIHPFADGNGRVARVLASVYLLRAVSLPLVLFADRKPRYIGALASADAGQKVEFVREVLVAVEDLANLLVERARASRPLDGASIDLVRWRQRYDEAAAFARAVQAGVSRARTRHRIRPDAVEQTDLSAVLPTMSMGAGVVRGDLPELPSIEIPISLVFRSMSISEILDLRFELLADNPRPYSVRARLSGHSMAARGDEVWPTPGMGFELRLDSWLDQVVGALAVQLTRRLEP